MKRFFGYIRVSTARQGQGVSLIEQRNTILRYAERYGLTITRWFEERETASKAGRPVFAAMLRLLRRQLADGVVVHKVDRSARNMTEWGEMNKLIDDGLVRIAHDDLDLQTRGGRLTADMQAVVAADYSRNLREEVRKGLYGRLKQGFYPFAAPIGYLNAGGGKPKQRDPLLAPLIRQAFELYATGAYTLRTLHDALHLRGLRNRRGGPLGKNALSEILNNPFYAGVIRIRRNGQVFQGIHEPLITSGLFERVQDVLAGRIRARSESPQFAYRRVFRCRSCGYALTPERQKGHTYYRCHSKTHPVTCIREEALEDAIGNLAQSLSLSPSERAYATAKLSLMTEGLTLSRENEDRSLQLRSDRVERRLQRLTDALLDDVITRDAFHERRESLLMEKAQLQADSAVRADPPSLLTKALRHFELLKCADSHYKSWTSADKCEFLLIVTSNRTVSEKNVAFALQEPFLTLSHRTPAAFGGPYRDRSRTWKKNIGRVIEAFFEWILAHPEVPAPKVPGQETELGEDEQREAA